MKGFIFNHEKYPKENEFIGKTVEIDTKIVAVSSVFNSGYYDDTTGIVNGYFDTDPSTRYLCVKTIHGEACVQQRACRIIGGVTDILCAFIHGTFSHFRKVVIA